MPTPDPYVVLKSELRSMRSIWRGKGDGAGLLGCVTRRSRWVFFMPTPDPYVVSKSELKSMRAQ